jgi:peptidoglycan/LPS O-acetylase OafA/YrhL
VAGFFPNIEYFCPVLRVAEFCAGILAAQSFQPGNRLANATLWEAAVLGAVAFQVAFQNVHYSLDQLSFLFVFTAAVWVFAHQEGAISRWLARQDTLILLGEASFSLYMWHHMVLTLGNLYLPKNMWAPAAAFLAMGTSIVVSVVSFRYFETPARRIVSKLL